MADVTRILQRAQAGEKQAAEELLPLVYDDLRRLAAARMARESPGQTLQPTALVHDAWLRIQQNGEQPWQNRRHFFAAAAEAMRRILIERARSRQRLRHGGGQERVDLDQIELPEPLPDEQMLRIHDALDELSRINPEEAEIVKLRFFVGLKVNEIATVLGLSESTVQRSWNHAKAWLYQRMEKES